MRIPTHLLFLVITSALCNIPIAHAQDENARRAEAAPKVDPPVLPRLRRVKIQGLLVKISRSDVKAFIDASSDMDPSRARARKGPFILKNDDTPKVGYTPKTMGVDLTDVDNDKLQKTLNSWEVQKRAEVKDFTYLTVESNRTAELCFVEAETISDRSAGLPYGPSVKISDFEPSPYAQSIPYGRTIVWKQCISVYPSVNNDDTLSLTVGFGRRTTLPPPVLPPPRGMIPDSPFNHYMTRADMNMLVALYDNKTLVAVDFGFHRTTPVPTSRVSLFLLSMRVIEPETAAPWDPRIPAR